MKPLASSPIASVLAVPFSPSVVRPARSWVARVELVLFASTCGYFVLALLYVACQA
jgi:hypothetical protein